MSWFAPAGAPASVEEVGAGGAVVAPPLPGATVSVVVGSASAPPVELVTSREELELEDDELLELLEESGRDCESSEDESGCTAVRL